jgi:hypothetical protein
MRRSSHSLFGAVVLSRPSLFVHPYLILLLLGIVAPISLADDAALLQDTIKAYADNPGDTLFLHVRIAPGVIFHPETSAPHKNVALDAVDISEVGHEINSVATPKYKHLTLCFAKLNELSASQCQDWSSHWSRPAWDATSNRPCQRGICSIVLLLSSGLIHEPQCSALPRIHLKKISSLNKNSCRNQGHDGPTCRAPVFDITANRSMTDNVDPRLELILNEQLDLNDRILGISSHQHTYRPYPTNPSEIQHFFVGQEHIISELQDILEARRFDAASDSCKVLVLVFAGIFGTGKTLLAGLIASAIHGQDLEELRMAGKFFRQDMESWSNPEASDALFGVKQASYHSFPFYL